MNSSKTLPTRIYYLDVAKVLCAFLVIYAHLFSTDSLTRLYIYSFHMPLFFIISGIFHKYAGLKQTKNIRRIIIPAIFFCVIYDILKPFANLLFDSSQFENIHFSIITCFKNDCISFFRSKMPSNTVCWFLFALFWCKVYADIIIKLYNKFFCTKFKNEYIQFVLLIPFIPLSLVHLPFFMSHACMAIPFYFFGYFYAKQLKSLNKNKIRLYAIFVFLLMNILITTVNGRVSMVGISYGHLNYALRIPVFYLNGIVGTMMVINFSLYIDKCKSFFFSVSNSLITIVGIQKLFNSTYVQLTNCSFDFFIPFVTSIVIMMLCYGFHLLLERFFPWILGKNTQKSI